jgi:hypothetical protein
MLYAFRPDLCISVAFAGLARNIAACLADPGRADDLDENRSEP